MHTFKGKKIRIHHDGDYGGEVLIIVPTKKVVPMGKAGGKINYSQVIIDFDELKDFVANYVRDERMGRLEDAESDDVLFGKVN